MVGLLRASALSSSIAFKRVLTPFYHLRNSARCATPSQRRTTALDESSRCIISRQRIGLRIDELPNAMTKLRCGHAEPTDSNNVGSASLQHISKLLPIILVDKVIKACVFAQTATLIKEYDRDHVLLGIPLAPGHSQYRRCLPGLEVWPLVRRRFNPLIYLSGAYN